MSEGNSGAPTGAHRERLLEKVGQLRWIHTIDLGGGVATPGAWGPLNPCITRALDSVDFRGKKVLDIGCWDGYWSFEAEARGAAEVYATDLITQREFAEDSTLMLAREIRGSRVAYHPDLSVFDVERLGVRDFDVVIYPGVFYHLKDPLLSFARLRRVMKDDAVMIVEGAVLPDDECFARFYYDEPYLHDRSNWWVPTVDCLRQWVACSFLRHEADFGYWDAGNGNLRFTLTARAVRQADPGYIRPDDDLAEYDLNAYPEVLEGQVAAAAPSTSRWTLHEGEAAVPKPKLAESIGKRLRARLFGRRK